MRPWLPLAALGLFVLAAMTAYAMARSLSPSLGLGLYGLANLILFIDFGDLLIRLYSRRSHVPETASGAPSPSIPLTVGSFTPYQRRLHVRPYALLVSVHDTAGETPRFLHASRPYRSHLWVIDDKSTDDTVERLRQAGVRCIETSLNRKKPGAIRLLLRQLPPEIETVVVLDPDISILGEDLESVIFDFQRSGKAAMAPRITVRRDGFLALLQAFEYELCGGIGRKSLADHCTTPGAAVYDRKALEAQLERHSLSVYAEDLENSVRLLAAGGGVYYDDRLVVETEGKRSLRGWFSQRVGWYFGLLRVYVDCFADLRKLARRGALAIYHYFFYAGFLTLLLHPARLAALVLLLASAAGGVDQLLATDLLPRTGPTDPIHFTVAYLQYLLFSVLALFVAVPRGERRGLAAVVPVYFFYSLLQIVPATVAYLNWFGMRLFGRRLFHDHYQDEESLRRGAARRPAVEEGR